MKKRQQILGIDIGDKNMKLSMLDQRKGITTVYAYGEYDVENFMKNGRIESHDYIRDCIKTFMQEHKIGKPKVILTIPNKNGDCSYTKIFDMKKLTPKEHEKALPIEIEDRFPIKDFNDYIQTHHSISETGSGKDLRIIAVLAKKEVFNTYMEIFHDDKLSKLDVVIQSKTTSMLGTVVNDDSINLIIDMGYNSTEFIVSKGQTPLLVKSINFGGALITEMISRMMNASIDDAETMKINDGRILVGHEDLAENDTQKALSDIIFPQMGLLFSEIEKTITIAKTQLNVSIAKIYTAGGTSKLTYLNEYIESTFKTDVIPLIPYFLMDNQDLQIKHNGMLYASTFGSSYQAFKEPLTPLYFTPKDPTKNKKVVLGVIALLLSILVILNGVMFIQMKIIESNLKVYSNELTDYQNQDMQLSQEFQSLEAMKSEKEQERQLKEQENYQLSQLIKSKINHVDYLKVIRDMVPTTVQTNLISINEFDLKIDGLAGTYSDIGYFVKELSYRSEFKDIDFTFSEQDKISGNYVLRYFTFTITGKIVHPIN